MQDKRVKAHLLLGAPGVGKTRHARIHSETTGGTLVYHLLHSWSDADELFYGINVTAAVSGDAANVKQEGVLAKAARLSLQGLVTLCLDEIDKTSEATENLLLDFLQNGRVPVAPGEQIQANLQNLTVFLTTNDMRPLSDALLRRVRRNFMQPLPVAEQEKIIHERTNAPKGIVTTAWKAARWNAEAEGNKYLSIDEGIGLVEELLQCSSKQEAEQALVSWSIRKADGLRNVKNNPHTAAMLSLIHI